MQQKSGASKNENKGMKKEMDAQMDMGGGEDMRSQENMQMSMGQQATGASNLEYDLVAEMHEMLEGNAALEKYIRDARQAGDGEAERCFQHIHDQNKQSVATLRQILAQRLSKAA